MYIVPLRDSLLNVSAAVFEDSILAEANAVKVERSRSGVEKSQIM